MTQERTSHVPPLPVVVLMDTIGVVLSGGPGAAAVAGVIVYLREIWHLPLGLFAPLCLVVPLIFVGTFLLALLILRLIVPRMRKGLFPLGMSLGTVAWYCHLALSRAAAVAGIKDLLHSFYLTRFLYARALGARVALRINTAQSIGIVDYPMVTIGTGCTLAEGVHISAHTFLGDKLFVRPVTIGRDVFIGKDCLIGARSSIGDGSWIGFLNRIYGDRLPAGTRLPDVAWEYGNPRKHQRRGIHGAPRVQEAGGESPPEAPPADAPADG